MKLFYILIHICLSFLVVASELPPDISARSSGVTTYTVTAVDRADTYKTEALLRSTYGHTNVVTERHNGIFMSWIVTSPDSQLNDAIKALSGVQNVVSKHENRDDNRHELQIRGESASAIPTPEELKPRDDPWYSCLANDTDVQKTEEFLKSKVKPGSQFYTMQNRDEVIGWWRLYLDDDAKKAVEAYEGVRYFKRDGNRVEDFRALPRDSQPLSKFEIRALATEEHVLGRRSGSWTKQQNADKALVMDSQYQ